MKKGVDEVQSHLAIARSLAQEFGATAIERDAKGGMPKQERDRLRQSGLLRLIIPKAYGGAGATWMTTFQVIREFAQFDSSIAQILSYHYLSVVIPHILGSKAQKKRYYTETAQHNWFWCNALNPLDRRATLTPGSKSFQLNGVKGFCAGSKDSDMMLVTAVVQATEELMVLAIPSRRDGIQILGDWDNLGQRQTDSGSVIFHNVQINLEEVIGRPQPVHTPFQTIQPCLTQLNLANIYLGIAQGAFTAAKHFSRSTTNPWLNSPLESATQDPYILQHYGNLWVDWQAATCLTDRAIHQLDAAWEQGEHLTAEQRGHCAVAIAVAKVAATRVGLEITNRMYEVMGTHATHSKYGFDRYWRNLRTLTLHDPLDYQLRDVGNWVLNDVYPNPTLY